MQHVPWPHSPSEQQTPVLHVPLQHFRPEPHCASPAQPHAAALQRCVPTSQHSPVTQSPFEWQHAAQVPASQQRPAPHSASAQQTPDEQLPAQHRLPAPHWASVEQLQAVEVQRCVPRSQHCPVKQSVLEWQQGWHVPDSQHAPAPHSESEQHAPDTQLPPQQTRPAPHWAELVQAQTLALQRWWVGSQHWPATQSPSEWQQLTQAFDSQHAPPPQSASAQQTPLRQAPPQHRLPAPHCASFEHRHAVALQACATGSQHCPARQSPSVQQLPSTQTVRSAGGAPASVPCGDGQAARAAASNARQLR